MTRPDASRTRNTSSNSSNPSAFGRRQPHEPGGKQLSLQRTRSHGQMSRQRNKQAHRVRLSQAFTGKAARRCSRSEMDTRLLVSSSSLSVSSLGKGIVRLKIVHDRMPSRAFQATSFFRNCGCIGPSAEPSLITIANAIIVGLGFRVIVVYVGWITPAAPL
jgi:hypothetical protein